MSSCLIPDGITGPLLVRPARVLQRLDGRRGRERLSGGDATVFSSERSSHTTSISADQHRDPHLDITAAGARSERSQSDPHTVLFQQQKGAGKVWRNAVSLPAPDQPVFGLQQPAR